MPVFDQLQKASFGNIEFPVSRVLVHGAQRYHVHEYPHTPGGQLEILERKLYEVRMSVPFHATFPGYPGLWPDRLATLRTRFEQAFSDVLYIPTLGAITSVCVDWPIAMDAKHRSGEEGELVFIEDQSSAFLADSLIEVQTADISNANIALTAEVANLQTADPPAFAGMTDDLVAAGFSADIFDQIKGIANAIFAVQDQVDDFGLALESKILSLQRLLEQTDSVLRDPTLFRLQSAVQQTWDSANQLLQDLQQKNGTLQTYTVPRLMAVSDISTAIYGDTTRSIEILQNNPIDNAFAVPPGTGVRYYPAAA